MAMTVTATMSGTAANEHIYLWIRVLTGATEAGGASAAGLNASGGTTISVSLTPNGSSSLPCYAGTGDNETVTFTALANNTVDSFSADPDTWGAGFGRYTGTVTAGTPLTFGFNLPVGGADYTTWACYEVLSSGGSTPSVDASSPALASATGAGVKTVTSASFTPPAGSVVVALVCGGGTGSSGSFVMTVTNTGGLSFTQRAGTATVADQDTFVFTATVPGGGGAAPAPVQARPGKTWRRRFRHAQHLPLAPPPPAPVLNISAPAAVATGAVGQPVFSRYIAGIGGTGAGYFQDQAGTPRMVLGDAVWALPGNAGRWNSGNWQADFDTYLATRAGQGFTVVYCKPIGTTQSGNLDDNGKTFDSLYPFQGGTPSTGVSGANPSSGLTSSFWARIDYFLNSALAQGITVFLNAIGYSSDFDSGPGPLAGKSATEFTAYGTALGGRYASQPNLIWHLADDYFSDNDSLITAFMSGVQGAGDTHLVSIENMPESDSRNTFDASPTVLPWGTANAAYNFCYSYNVTYVGIEKAFLESSPLTPIQGDGYFYQGSSTYAGGSGAFAYDRAIRQDAWHAISSGARGIIHGSESTWQWASTALASSSTDWYYVHNAGVIRSVMEGLTGWQTLVPDTSSALVTAGRGTHATTFSSGGGGGQYEVKFTDSYVTASRTPDGGSGSSLAVIYLSHGTTITIDQTKMVSGYTATWVDPVSGATSTATTGTTYNSTAKGNNSQGDPDWVLVLQASTGTNVTAGIPVATGAAPQPAVTVSVLAGIPAATGTAPQPAASVSAKAGIPAATGTAAGPVPAIAVLPAAPTATGAAPAPSVQTAGTLNISAPAVTATGTAPAPLISISALPGIPVATGTAPAPAAAPRALAGLAAAAAAVTQPVPAIAVLPGVPAATGAAPAPSVQTAGTLNISVAAVTATGTAAGPVPASAVLAGLAAATGFAPATAHGVPAGIPSATGTAPPPSPALAIRTAAAQALGVALNAAIPAQHVPATSAASVTSPHSSTATVTDPRDGTSRVTARATSAPAVTNG